MRIRDFHAIDLDEDEVVHLLCQDGCVELGDHLPDGRGLAGSWCPGDVDTGARPFSYGGTEVGVDHVEFGLSTGEGSRNAGDMEVGPRLAIWRGKVGR